MSHITSLPASVLDATTGCSKTVATENATVFSTTKELQQIQRWDNNATGWPAAAMGSGEVSLSGEGCNGGGRTVSTWTDSAGYSVAYGNGQGVLSGQGQLLSSNGIGSRSSSSYYASQYAEAAAKRQRRDSSTPTPMAGVAKPVGQGCASLLSGIASVPSGNEFGNEFGGVPAYGMCNTNRGGLGGFGGLDDGGLGDVSSGGVGGVDAGSAWIDAVLDGESTSASLPNLLFDK